MSVDRNEIGFQIFMGIYEHQAKKEVLTSPRTINFLDREIHPVQSIYSDLLKRFRMEVG